MPHRHEAWLAQAQRDLAVAHLSFDADQYEWCAYQAQQAAEKALKALLRFHSYETRGHALLRLREVVQRFLKVSPELIAAAQELDQHYFRARYPDSLSSGYPGQAYDDSLGAECLRNATTIIEFVTQNIS